MRIGRLDVHFPDTTVRCAEHGTAIVERRCATCDDEVVWSWMWPDAEPRSVSSKVRCPGCGQAGYPGRSWTVRHRGCVRGLPLAGMTTRIDARRLRQFGTSLREAREAEGISQEQLARKLRVAQATVQRWEAGKSVPNEEAVVAVAGRYGGVFREQWERMFLR